MLIINQYCFCLKSYLCSSGKDVDLHRRPGTKRFFKCLRNKIQHCMFYRHGQFGRLLNLKYPTLLMFEILRRNNYLLILFSVPAFLKKAVFTDVRLILYWMLRNWLVCPKDNFLHKKKITKCQKIRMPLLKKKYIVTIVLNFE